MYWPFVKSEVSLSTSSSHTSARINLPQLKDSMSGKSGSTSAANHHVLPVGDQAQSIQINFQTKQRDAKALTKILKQTHLNN